MAARPRCVCPEPGRLHRVGEPGCRYRCCDMHNRHCEPPGDLCCFGCAEAGHPRHPVGIPCVLEVDDLVAARPLPRIESADAPNLMTNEAGERFFPDNPDDAAYFAEHHGARAVHPEAGRRWLTDGP